jgi:3-hydroxyacyl-[acyl-carrier-protein] dehydratase
MTATAHPPAASHSRFVVPDDHPCLPGHFPGRPVVPGVVVLDAVLAAVEAARGAALPPGQRLPQVKFVRPLLPAQPASVQLERLDATAAGEERWRFKVVDADGAALASGELALATGGAA